MEILNVQLHFCIFTIDFTPKTMNSNDFTALKKDISYFQSKFKRIIERRK